MESVFVGLEPLVQAVSSVWRTTFRHCKDVQVRLYWFCYVLFYGEDTNICFVLGYELRLSTSWH